MTKQPEQQSAAMRPASPGIVDRGASGVKPWELDPDLAAAKLAENLINKLGTPSIISKKFAVRYGIFHALNHQRGFNETGYDSSIRLAVYRQVAAQSVNVDGEYFRNTFALLMKPKYILQGGVMMPGQFQEEQKESIFGKIVNWFRGGKKNESAQQQ